MSTTEVCSTEIKNVYDYFENGDKKIGINIAS
jgi:hypothetical protein